MNNSEKFTGLINKNGGAIPDFNVGAITGNSKIIGINFDFSKILIELEIIGANGTIQGVSPNDFFTFENGVFNFQFSIFSTAGNFNAISIISFPLNFPVKRGKNAVRPFPDSLIWKYDNIWDIEIRTYLQSSLLIALKSKKSIFDSQAAFFNSPTEIITLRFESNKYFPNVNSPFSCTDSNLRMYAILKT